MGLPVDELFGPTEADEILTMMNAEDLIMFDNGVVVSSFSLHACDSSLTRYVVKYPV